MVHLLIH